MYSSIINVRKGESINRFIAEYETFEEALKDVSRALEEDVRKEIFEAFIYRCRNPNVSDSGIMVASLRTIR